jgi:hypothetical protein
MCVNHPSDLSIDNRKVNFNRKFASQFAEIV